MQLKPCIKKLVSVVLFLAASFYAEAFPAFASSGYDELFTVRWLSVDNTDTTAAVAREKGILEAEKKAYDIVLKRLTLPSDAANLPVPSSDELVNLVQDLSISGEKTSSVRYMADLAVRFKSDAVKKLLQDNSLSFVNSVAKPLAILPIYIQGVRTVLWEEDNPWLNYWREHNPDNPLVQLHLPYGDALDNESTAPLFSGSNSFNIQALKDRYQVSGILLLEMKHNKDSLNVTVIPVGQSGEDSFTRFSLTVSLNAGLQKGMEAAVNAIITTLNNEWKENNAVYFSEASSIVVIVPITSLKDWLEVKQRLDKAAFIKHYDLQAMRKDKVQLTISFARSPDKLATELAAGGLILEQTPKGLWILYDAKNAKIPPKAEPEEETSDTEISVWGISELKE